MSTQYDKRRYVDKLGYGILQTKGANAGESTLPYLHYSRTYMLLYFSCGTGSVKVEGRHYSMSAGDVLILNPSELFRVYVDDGAYHERFALTVSEDLFASYPDATATLFAPFLNRAKGVGNKIPAETAKESGIIDCFERIFAYASGAGDVNRLRAFCLISELLILLGEVVATAPAAVSQSVSNPIVGEVLEYINVHYTEDIDIPHIAAEFNIDKSYLAHLFKEHVGMSLWTYVVLRRIKQFNTLVENGESTEESAYKAGFKNYSNFYRLYKKYMNITPTQFRKQIKPRGRTVPEDIKIT